MAKSVKQKSKLSVRAINDPRLEKKMKKLLDKKHELESTIEKEKKLGEETDLILDRLCTVGSTVRCVLGSLGDLSQDLQYLHSLDPKDCDYEAETDVSKASSDGERIDILVLDAKRIVHGLQELHDGKEYTGPLCKLNRAINSLHVRVANKRFKIAANLSKLNSNISKVDSSIERLYYDGYKGTSSNEVPSNKIDWEPSTKTAVGDTVKKGKDTYVAVSKVGKKRGVQKPRQRNK